MPLIPSFPCVKLRIHIGLLFICSVPVSTTLTFCFADSTPAGPPQSRLSCTSATRASVSTLPLPTSRNEYSSRFTNLMSNKMGNMDMISEVCGQFIQCTQGHWSGRLGRTHPTSSRTWTCVPFRTIRASGVSVPHTIMHRLYDVCDITSRAIQTVGQQNHDTPGPHHGRPDHTVQQAYTSPPQKFGGDLEKQNKCSWERCHGHTFLLHET